MNRFQYIKHSERACRFCTYLEKTSEHTDINTPWLSSGIYSAFVSVGSLVSGWSLIVPKSHALNLSEEYNRAEFWDFSDDAARIIEDRFGRFCIFEHGAFTEASTTGCGTGHAHLHMVPLPFSLIDEAKKFDVNLQWEDCFVTDIREKTQNREYLYVADEYQSSRTLGKICFLNDQTSQFFRKVIAKKIGIPLNYDYKVFPMLEVALRSRESLVSSKYLSKKTSITV